MWVMASLLATESFQKGWYTATTTRSMSRKNRHRNSDIAPWREFGRHFFVGDDGHGEDLTKNGIKCHHPDHLIYPCTQGDSLEFQRSSRHMYYPATSLLTQQCQVAAQKLAAPFHRSCYQSNRLRGLRRIFINQVVLWVVLASWVESKTRGVMRTGIAWYLWGGVWERMLKINKYRLTRRGRLTCDMNRLSRSQSVGYRRAVFIPKRLALHKSHEALATTSALDVTRSNESHSSVQRIHLFGYLCISTSILIFSWRAIYLKVFRILYLFECVNNFVYWKI